MRSLLFVGLILGHFAIATENAPFCAMYMAPSTIPGAGRGIIAGKDYDEEEMIDTAISLTVPASYIGEWQLQNYVYASEEEGHSMALFGVGMLFNHLLPPTVHHYWDTYGVALTADNKYVPSTTYSAVAHNTTVKIKRGQEIFTSYGDDAWFADRGIYLDVKNGTASEGGSNSTTASPISDSHPYPSMIVSEEDLLKNGHCITDIYVDKSDKTLGGFGVFATRSFKKGEIVSISPVLTLPKEELEDIQSDSVLQNYCISPANSTVALFPIGYSSLVNHDKNPNMAIEWFSWPNDPPGKLQALLDLPATELLKKEFAQLDIAFRATEDIEANSELYIDYGLSWLQDWAEYLSNEVAFGKLEENEQKILEEEDARPLFRAFIGPPASFQWPEGWRVDPVKAAAAAAAAADAEADAASASASATVSASVTTTNTEL